MREIGVSKIRDTVRDLCLKANFELREDILKALKASIPREKSARAKNIIKMIIENARFAKKRHIAICQDTGLVVVHLELGQDVALSGGSVNDAIDDGAGGNPGLISVASRTLRKARPIGNIQDNRVVAAAGTGECENSQRVKK